MKEEMLQNDTEDIRQENKKASVSGNGADNEVIDLTEDEWSDTDTDGDNPGMTSGISESVLPLLKTVLPIACAALLILLLIITGLSGKKTDEKEMKESFVSSAPRQETMTEAQEAKPAETSAGQIHGTEDGTMVLADYTKEIEDMAASLEEAQKKYQSLHDMVFGENGRSASLGCVTAVTGFTDREKREIGFLEADFLKDAGAFLAGQQIQTKRIIIEDRIAGSSNAAVAFQGRLEGKDDYILDVIFYPDLPGEYIFLLRNVKGNERENDAETTTESAGQNAGGNSSQAQNVLSNTPAQEATQQAVTSQNTQPAVQPQQPQNTYDATNLSVKKIPETLLNYLNNRYEFQYDLYDWLYRHGKREVSSATVTDYSIDGDSRTATIELTLSDGSDVTAVYNKSSNTYSFER